MASNRLVKYRDLIDGINTPRSTKKAKPRFEDSHRRMTTYVREDLYRRIQSLRDTGDIPKVTNFVNDALEASLNKRYPETSLEQDKHGV